MAFRRRGVRDAELLDGRREIGLVSRVVAAEVDLVDESGQTAGHDEVGAGRVGESRRVGLRHARLFRSLRREVVGIDLLLSRWRGGRVVLDDDV